MKMSQFSRTHRALLQPLNKLFLNVRINFGGHQCFSLLLDLATLNLRPMSRVIGQLSNAVNVPSC